MIDIYSGNGTYPILDIIGTYTDNTYVLYYIFDHETKKIKTTEERISAIENRDPYWFKHRF
jgi:hypothetical protein